MQKDALMALRLFVFSSLILGLGLAATPAAFGQTDEQVTAARARGVKFLKEKLIACQDDCVFASTLRHSPKYFGHSRSFFLVC